MFEQFVGTGADIFIAIFVGILGFAVALGYVDFLKTRKDNEKNIPPPAK